MHPPPFYLAFLGRWTKFDWVLVLMLPTSFWVSAGIGTRRKLESVALAVELWSHLRFIGHF